MYLLLQGNLKSIWESTHICSSVFVTSQVMCALQLQVFVTAYEVASENSTLYRELRSMIIKVNVAIKQEETVCLFGYSIWSIL